MCVSRRVLSALAIATALLIVPAVAQAQRANPFLKAKTWAFQLKNLEAGEQAKIAASPFDLVVIDSEKFPGGVETPLTKEEVERMKKKPDGSRRLVIAYMSAGETENYRFYWKPEWNKNRPSWMGKENKQWPGNYLAQYWQPVWQNIIFGNPNSFVDRIINSGFDGFYVDRADAYYYYGDTQERRSQMADFIIKMTNYMRAKKPDVAILVQNAEELLDKPDYVAAIDGIAKEDLIFGISHSEKMNPKDDIEPSTALLQKAQKAGKAIFVIEYLKQQANIDLVKKRLDELGFVMYVGPRGLGELIATGGPRPGPEDPNPGKVGPEPKKEGKVKQLINKVLQKN
jgi:cysteinyl-tRNA synthetase, unknown class